MFEADEGAHPGCVRTARGLRSAWRRLPAPRPEKLCLSASRQRIAVRCR